MAANKRSGERAASRCPQDFLRRPERHRSLQPRSKVSLLPVYGAREMDRRENLRTRLEKVIFYIKRGQFILRFFLKQTDEMWCIEQPRKKAWRLG